MGKIMVIGALVLDMTFVLPRWLQPNDYMRSQETRLALGGKGFNQAAVVKRLGGDSELVASIGSDTLGDLALSLLANEDIAARTISRHPNATTGVIGILLHAGQPSFIGADHAGHLLSADFVRQSLQDIGTDDVVSISFEAPQEAVIEALERAKENGSITILNPAPIDRALAMPYLSQVDVLIPNQYEARLLLDDQTSSIEALATQFLERGVGAVCITLGERGCYYADDARAEFFPAIEIELVDATGASDAFCGAFAFGLSHGWDTRHIVTMANRVAGITCTVPGIPRVYKNVTD